MDFAVCKECTLLADQEKIPFPEIVQRLLAAGIELYYADLLAVNKTYYSKSSAFTLACLETAKHEIADEFLIGEVKDAIKQSQAGKIKYQEFLKKVKAAGVISYMVFLKGRKAIYFGRKGEQHIEEFPK